ncbi:MAG: hypothetical protein IIA88_04240 [Bacteroidetes bacterium]|nr:hypothetical protein [Bacteroidota bacterium]
MKNKIYENSTAFDLKEKGEYEFALKKYAQDYIESLKRDNNYIPLIRFEEILHCCILYFKNNEEPFNFKDSNLIFDKIIEIAPQLKESSDFNEMFDDYKVIFTKKTDFDKFYYSKKIPVHALS